MSYVRVVYLGDVDKGRDNNLNLLRLLLASGVIMSHSWVSLGLLASEPVHNYLEFTDLGTIAVYGFFFISGYLILKSAIRWSGPDEFLASRFLRIFPGLIVSVILCVFVFGPAMTSLTLQDYLESPLTRSFLSEIWMHRMQHLLPGVCERYPLPSINAALWTLPGEWLMYIATMVACLAFRWRSLRTVSSNTWFAIFTVLLLTAQMMPLQWIFAFQWFRYFLLGSACYLFRKRLPLSIPGAMSAFALDVVSVHYNLKGSHLLFQVALSYLVITIGYHPAVYVQSMRVFGDYSYGLYIYGLPIQQLMLKHFSRPVPFFLTCYPLILLAAVLSWHYIEKPSLSMKRRLRRRGDSRLAAYSPQGTTD